MFPEADRMCGWSNLTSLCLCCLVPERVARGRSRETKGWTGWTDWRASAAKEVRGEGMVGGRIIPNVLPNFAMTGRERLDRRRVGKE